MAIDFSKLISPEAMTICQKLGTSALMKEFCLAGGTGLALQLKHRRSDDLDFFLANGTKAVPVAPLLQTLERIFPNDSYQINLRESTQLDLTILGTKLTYLAYPFPLINPLVEGTSVAPFLKGINLAAPQEIALMKAYSIGRRATFRDYIDLYFLFITKAVELAYIEEHAKQKFIIGGETCFSMKQFLEQISFSMDIPDKLESINMILGKQLSAEDIDNYLSEAAKNYLQKSLPDNKISLKKR
jgi:hypothetical protein